MTLYRVPRGEGTRPATERDGGLPRLRRHGMPAPFTHPWKDYDVTEVDDTEASEEADRGASRTLLFPEAPVEFFYNDPGDLPVSKPVSAEQVRQLIEAYGIWPDETAATGRTPKEG